MLRFFLHLLKLFRASLQSCHLVLKATNYEMYTLIVVVVSSRLIVITMHELEKNESVMYVCTDVHTNERSTHVRKYVRTYGGIHVNMCELSHTRTNVHTYVRTNVCIYKCTTVGIEVILKLYEALRAEF